MNYLEKVRKQVGLEEGEQVLERLLLGIYFQPGIPTKISARKCRLPVPLVAAIKKECLKAGLLSKRGGIHCTPEGERFVENILGFQGIDKELYSRVLVDLWDQEKAFKQELITLSELFAERPQVDVTFDQSKCTPETSLRRAILCLQNYSLIGKDILCVGDDDLVSISIGFLVKRLFHGGSYPTNIHVLDIDNRFLEYIREIAEKHSFPIHCHCVDLRQQLPEYLAGHFDGFFTDPPYTLQGMNLFLSRGIEGLKNKEGLAVLLSFAHKPPNFALDMQRNFVQMGLAVTNMIPAFNEYEGAGIIGNTGQMIVLRTTSQTVPLIKADFSGALYTGEVKRTIRNYQCKQCKKFITVGVEGAYKTIEDLKREGCSHCRNTSFDLVERRKM